MTPLTPVIVLASLLASPLALSSDHPAGSHVSHAGHAAAAAPATMSEGSIKKVDASAGKLTISHGPLANLGMPAMTMSFAVKDRSWLTAYKPGDRVRFVADQTGGTYTVVQIEAAR